MRDPSVSMSSSFKKLASYPANTHLNVEITAEGMKATRPFVSLAISKAVYLKLYLYLQLQSTHKYGGQRLKS